MIVGDPRRLLAAAVAAGALAGAVSASSALAAYPPVPPKPPLARCKISTIVDRRVSIICNAGRARARHRGAMRIGKTIVAHGLVGQTGVYVARVRLRKRLTRGTLIRFLVDGKILVTIRV
jgi:hypothetical protein